MIELGKQYRTYDGREVRIYAVEDKGAFPVHGAVLDGGTWRSQAWLSDGVISAGKPVYDDLDLIEIRPRAIDRMIELLQMHMNAYSQQFGPNPYRLLIEEARRFKAEEDAQS